MSVFFFEAKAQLTVDNTMTPVQLVEQILVGQGVAISNVVFNGQPATAVHDQIGRFNGSGSALGLAEGVVLATGRIPVVTGPNNDMSAAMAPSSAFSNPADPDLLQISTTTILRDQAILEFDFVPVGDTITFRFVFGSEEYPEYVCSQWNDVFGFFLSGPGISGPFSNAGVNLALVPGTVVPIAINTVNSGAPGALGGGAFVCAASDPNWQANSVYYVDNTGGTTMQLDGFTVPLTAGARVRCGEVYHIKIALADAGDASVDSAVFLEGGSFSSAGAVTVRVETPQGDGTLTEGCGQALVVVEREDASEEVSALVWVGGDGISDTDVSGVPPAVLLPVGQTSASFSWQAMDDGLAEGSEAMYIVVATTNACGQSITDTAWVDLLDYEPMTLQVEVPELACDHDEVDLHATVSGGLGTVQLVWGTGEFGPVITVPGMENGSYSVSATDQCPRTVSAAVEVLSGCNLDIPNVFTPNGDGVNDAWVIEGILGTRNTVRVFNRWGQIVFEATDYRNTWRAAGLPDGTYFYEVVSEMHPDPFTGALTILSNGRK
jgi:gliding motility-associated-like protein